MANPAIVQGDMWWTDVLSPWTLQFYHSQEEALFASEWKQSRARLCALGSLAGIMLPATMALKVLFLDGGHNEGFGYGVKMMMVMILMRGAPFFSYVALPKPMFHATLPALTVIVRLFNAAYNLHYIVLLQFFGLSTGCQLLRGVLMDVLMMSLVVEPLLKPTMFRGYVVLSVVESLAAMYAVSSQHGLCGALQVLNTLDVDVTCPASCMAVSKESTCESVYSSTPTPQFLQLPQLWQNLVTYMLVNGVGAPEGATSIIQCPQVLVAGIDRCKGLVQLLQNTARFMSRMVTWMSAYPYRDPRALYPGAIGTCAAVFILLVVLIQGLVGSVLYCTEAMSRSSFWQARHSSAVLHPPLHTLRAFLLVQNLFFLFAALCTTWMLLSTWL